MDGTKASQRSQFEGESRRLPPSDWVLIFDCETRTTPDQRLRFGGYQLRHKGQLWERGAFYEPATLSEPELDLLRRSIASEESGPDAERIRLLTRAEFVDEVFYASGYAVGAQIVGFNLPFDLPRSAIRHASARRSMRGGFSLTLSDKDGNPAVAVKHLSQRAAMIRFTGVRPEKKGKSDGIAADAPHESEERADVDRGYFVDVKTLAAAITSGSHSLASLSELLKVPTEKAPSEEHGGPLTEDYIRYGLRDVQTTWECFDSLAKRFETFGLDETGLYDLYSEASLGKAYLKAMNIRPWRKLQPDFPPEIVGNILSAYYGGRAEVHIRRQIVPVIHCDFLSMYPTVCTLMGLWKFVCARGVSYRDDSDQVRAMLDRSPEELIERLREKSAWSDLAVLVQVSPKEDIFPVRANYTREEPSTIGLNYLTGDDPLWFTLADVLVSKILTGRAPEVVRTIRFEPLEQQEGLRTIQIAGETINPASDDFYRTLIIHRSAVRKKAKTAPEQEKAALESDQLGIKILANSTSYGIFVELNVEDYDAAKPMVAYGAQPRPIKFKSKKFEKPGAYFHPLLGTLITGAARLMLALAERQVIAQGLDWAFCDTDSMAIANINGLPQDEFEARALQVHAWFKDLNPYGETRPILQLEKVNFPIGRDRDIDVLDPPLCLAISAKRYVLFNRKDGAPMIRKASGHGLGHLLPPYDEPAHERRDRIQRIGLPLWQEDLWKEIIRAAESETPDQTSFMAMQAFDVAAASPYAATTPELLAWFNGYNGRHIEGERIFPFGFLLSLQAKSRLEMAKDDPAALANELWYRREPRPAAPYFTRAMEAKDHAFDRLQDLPVPASWLKSHGRSLIRYHLHQETKFWGGEYEQRGPLKRRHVQAIALQPIGKESDNIEEHEFIGADAGPSAHPLDSSSAPKLSAFVSKMQAEFRISDRALCEGAGVSHHTLASLRAGTTISAESLLNLVQAVVELRLSSDAMKSEAELGPRRLVAMRERLGGRNKLAKRLKVTGPYLGRVLSGERPITANLEARLEELSSEYQKSD
ncbi:MAG: hypothetical protein JWM36_2617 [Hyphomicrobiales bacterium]|nr:hypothetical protein [Hyphomicrobiales bacterium]